MIAIINYGAGNLLSVKNTINDYTNDVIITNNLDDLEKAEKIILPGVGEASFAMNSLKKLNIVSFLQNTRKPVLGICLGLQLMCSFSEEGNVECLNIFPSIVKKFDDKHLKVPHMGWNQVSIIKNSLLLKDIENNSYFYFANSYYAEMNDYTVAKTSYQIDFSAILQKDNYFGIQFHPEKSSKIGSKIIRNFIEL
ncbi:MAG TPA: imidazole glycerol phosphate synthase subunit HisH [Ignavibacteriales bacterium]|nr:imidazole glycerol phosphate synthase subunit HisH [Ignavibacteriales bacterium]